MGDPQKIPRGSPGNSQGIPRGSPGDSKGVLSGIQGIPRGSPGDAKGIPKGILGRLLEGLQGIPGGAQEDSQGIPRGFLGDRYGIPMAPPRDSAGKKVISGFEQQRRTFRTPFGVFGVTCAQQQPQRLGDPQWIFGRFLGDSAGILRGYPRDSRAQLGFPVEFPGDSQGSLGGSPGGYLGAFFSELGLFAGKGATSGFE